MTIEFHWDKAKARQNLKKHGVSFEEATAAFYDPLSITVIDDEHLRVGTSRLSKFAIF